MEASRILVARRGNLAFVKVVGRGSFQNSGCLKSFYQQLLKEGVNRFAVDLDSCSYLDSTFLGTLLELGLKLRDSTKNVLHILNASARNLELMANLGLDRLFVIESKPTPPAELEQTPLQEVTCAVPSRAEAGPTILAAHEYLMEFDPRNIDKFKDVVEFLREGQERKSEDRPPNEPPPKK